MSDLDDFLKFKSRNDVFQCSYCGEFSEIDVKHEYKIMQDQLTTANKRIKELEEVLKQVQRNSEVLTESKFIYSDGESTWRASDNK